tara:strand:- start:7427 stop:8044 length:618 start_codon:yes stop_codon:yes gene_type:complete
MHELEGNAELELIPISSYFEHDASACRHIIVEEPNGDLNIGFNPEIAPPPSSAAKPSEVVLTGAHRFSIRYNCALKHIHYLTTLGWSALCWSKGTLFRILSLVLSAFVSFVLFTRDGRIELWRRTWIDSFDDACILLHFTCNMISIVYLTIYGPSHEFWVVEIVLNGIQWFLYLGIVFSVDIERVDRRPRSAATIHPESDVESDV